MNKLSSPAMSLSVIVACKNEKGNIEQLIRRTNLPTPDSEIIFVDGSSNDGTCEEVLRVAKLYPQKNVSLLHQTNTVGKGAAVRQGFEAAKAQTLIILDADISVDPEEMMHFYSVLTQKPGVFVNGSRFLRPMEKKAMRFLNNLGNRFFSGLLSWLLGHKLTDTLCGTKALYQTDYQKIANNRAYFGDFDPFGDFDLIFGAAKQGLEIVEIPVSYRARIYGTTKIKRFYHGFMLLKMCWVAFTKIKLAKNDCCDNKH